MENFPRKVRVENENISSTDYCEEKIQASSSAIWLKWTTREGLNSFFSADNDIEITPFGKYEIYFDMDSPFGMRGSEGCQVLSFLPNRMLSFTWNAPPIFHEVRNSPYHTWVVLNLKEINQSTTEVELIHLGWPEDEKWDPVFDYFDRVWKKVIDWLDQSFTNQK